VGLYEQWRLTREKADREALDRKREEGSLVKRDEVSTSVSSMISATKTKLRMIPAELCDKLATTKDPIRCRELMERKINEALSELAEYPNCA
jgi:phage terminase Nu1 subunit (DNA packaging protein)